MGRLIYSAITSLDGYTADADGKFDWSAPDPEVHAFVNDQERAVGTYLYGRRMYEVMVAWETMDLSGEPPVIADYAEIWRAAIKVVYSTTLGATDIASARTRLEPAFDPDAVAALKAASATDLGIGGPHLAAHALRAGLVDEINLLLSPVVVGGGTAALPDGLGLALELTAERRFANGVVALSYRPRG
jgi:dihydrofolate reductase